MRVVVTGSEGFLGRATVEAARNEGISVVGCDRSAVVGASDSSLPVDVADLGQVLEVMAGADAVVHLAAVKGDGLATPSQTFRHNVTTTHNVLTAAAMLGVPKVVLASSVRVVVPESRDDWSGYRYLPLDEDHPAVVRGEYARSKSVGETIADSMAAEHGLDIVSLRYPAIVDAKRAQFPVIASMKWPLGPHYVDVTDAARCTMLAATADIRRGDHRRCFVTATDTALDVPSRTFAHRYFPEAEWRGGDDDSFGSLMSGRTAAEWFGFEAHVSWRAVAVTTSALIRRRFRRGDRG